MIHSSTAAPPTDGPCPDALRIQAAAVVAQQAALVEYELRLRERETALAIQEVQIAAHLDEKRRQALELQDQIAVARAKLRKKRTAHVELATQQASELAKARNEAADLLGDARAQRARVARLWRKLRDRWWRERYTARERLAAAYADLAAGRERLEAERTELLNEAARANGEIELQQRRLQERQEQFDADRRDWRTQRAAEDAERREKLRDLALRSKTVAAEEDSLKRQEQSVVAAVRERRREIDRLETRIVNLRQKLLAQQGELLHAIPASMPSAGPEYDDAQQRRAELLAQIADELADQRLTLAEHTARLLHAREEWAAERERTKTELDEAAAVVQQQAHDLARRSRDLTASEVRAQADYEALGALRLRIEAERAAAEARASRAAASQRRRAAALVAREQRLDSRTAAWADLWRTWGQRRAAELDRLRNARAACKQERAEWAAARAVLLREGAKLQDERRAVAAQAGAVEQLRRETLEATDNPVAASRRVERLRRQWDGYCAAAARDLERLRATLAAESARLDEQAARVRATDRALDARVARVEAQAAEHERRQTALADEAARQKERLALARGRWEAAEERAETLRGEVESLARLLIETGGAPGVNQAA